MSMLQQSVVKQDWLRRGFSCGLWTDSPGQVWEDYTHDVDELLMLLEGELELKMQEHTWRPKIGQEVFIPARVSHTVRNIGETTARWLYGYRR
jgi:mannose-6-phosphate isomerase-like protein (cupin superfamily)